MSSFVYLKGHDMSSGRSVNTLGDTSYRGVPVSQVDFTEDLPAFGHYNLLNQERERARFLYNTTTERGFFMLQRYEDVQAGLQQHKNWTTSVRSALRPDPGQRLLPQDLNGEAHLKLRKILNQFFAPAAVRRLEPLATERCIELIEELKPKGECDFVAEFAIRYPTDLFLAMLGLPMSDGAMFLEWADALFAAILGGDADQASEARRNILGYFERALDDREKNPRDPSTDMVTRTQPA